MLSIWPELNVPTNLQIHDMKSYRKRSTNNTFSNSINTSAAVVHDKHRSPNQSCPFSHHRPRWASLKHMPSRFTLFRRTENAYLNTIVYPRIDDFKQTIAIPAPSTINGIIYVGWDVSEFSDDDNTYQRSTIMWETEEEENSFARWKYEWFKEKTKMWLVLSNRSF